MALTYSNDFFAGKRPWSLIKDEILTHYLPPYLKKVNNLNRRIVLVDGFAGPGRFDDGSYGSPYFMCKIASEIVPNNFLAVLVNKDKKHHSELTNLLQDYIKNKCGFTLHGTAQDLLKELSSIISDETLFIYLDQFGISGFCFNDLLPFLSRDKRNSTELLLNINVPIIHRLSCKRTHKASIVNSYRHTILTQTFGGDYWKDYLLGNDDPSQTQIFGLMEAYKQKLEEHLPHVEFCPIYEKGHDSTLKYFLIFASRHIDAAILLNDIMFKAYWKHIWNCEAQGTLFEDQGIEWILPRDYNLKLKEYIIDYLNRGKIDRKRLWCYFVKDHFMQFSASDFKKSVENLYKEKKINFIDVKGSIRLNDDSILYLNG